MTAIPLRAKVFGGLLTLVALLWLMDFLVGAGSPGSVQADPPADPGPISVPPSATESENTDERRWSFAHPQPTEPPIDLDRLDRDLFVPTPDMDAAYARMASESAAGNQNPNTDRESFAQRHALQGVMVGRLPFAVIDGTLLTLGAELDGFALVKIRRDHAVFERNGAQVTLKLTHPMSTAPGGGPATRG